MLTRSDLFPGQHQQIDFLKGHENAALFVPMGNGKTVSGLTAFLDMQRTFDARRVLVWGPLRVARRVWSDEIDTWAHLHGLTVAKIIGTPKERMKAMRTPADVHTINREQACWLKTQFVQNGKQTVRWPWDLVLNDESQGFMSQSSERWKAMHGLRWGDKKAGPLWPMMANLSGTPAPNGYQNLWAQFMLLDNGKRLGTSEDAFMQRFFLPPAHQYARPQLRDTAAQEIHELIADITLSLEDVGATKPRMNYIRVGLSGAVMAKYKALEKKFLMETFNGKTVTAVNAGVCAGKLCQLANGAIYTGEAPGAWEPLHDAKLEVLPEIIEASNGAPLVLVYSYKHDLARIGPVLTKMGVSWRLLTSDKDFDMFRAGLLDVGILHPASAGHGLNDLHLSGAETLVHFGMTNNWEWYAQVNARLIGGHRGSGRNIVIHHIIADRTIDDDLIELLDGKEADEYGLTTALARKAGVL